MTGGASDKAEVASAAAAFGIAFEPEPPKPYAVWPENKAVFLLFLACGTQWRSGGMSGHYTGLDYAAVALVAAAHQTPWTADLLADLQVMEREVLKVWGEKRRRSAPASKAPKARKTWYRKK